MQPLLSFCALEPCIFKRVFLMPSLLASTSSRDTPPMPAPPVRTATCKEEQKRRSQRTAERGAWRTLTHSAFHSALLTVNQSAFIPPLMNFFNPLTT